LVSIAFEYMGHPDVIDIGVVRILCDGHRCKLKDAALLESRHSDGPNPFSGLGMSSWFDPASIAILIAAPVTMLVSVAYLLERSIRRRETKR